jgi:hypothetical protein
MRSCTGAETIPMDFEWDSAKIRQNLERRGVSLLISLILPVQLPI